MTAGEYQVKEKWRWVRDATGGDRRELQPERLTIRDFSQKLHFGFGAYLLVISFLKREILLMPKYS